MPASSPLPTRKVLVVEDHDIVRLGVRHLLAAEPGLTVAGEVASLRDALDWLQRERCDLLLLDLNLGDEFSLSSVPRLREACPGMKIIVLTSLDEKLYAERALRAGVDGYLMKTALADTLLAAVRSVLAGQVWLSEALKSSMLLRLSGRGGGDAPVRPELSPREEEVLRLVAAGKTTREIADTLNRSVKTIETHKQALKTKLGADSPAQLVRMAIGWFGQTP